MSPLTSQPVDVSRDVRPAPIVVGTPRSLILPAVQAFNVASAPYNAGGRADDAQRINGAISDIAAIGGGRIYIPVSGFIPQRGYNINVPLNLANLGEVPVEILGDGLTQTGISSTLLCNTGGVALDTMGTQYLRLRGFVLYTDNTQPNPSTVGILMGRTAANQFAQFHTYEDILIFFPSIPGASARGTMGIYNVGAEHWRATHVRCIADASFILASTDVIGVPGPYSGAHGGPASMTLCELLGCTANAWTKLSYECFDAMNIDFEHVYATMQAGNVNTFGMGLNGPNIRRIRVTGQWENWPALLNLNADSIALEVDAFIVAPTATLIGAGAVINIDQSRFRVTQVNGIAQALFNTPAGTALRDSDVLVQPSQSINGAGLKILGGTVRVVNSGSPITVDPTSNFALFSASIQGSSADRGDASLTLQWGNDFQTQRFATALTANRTITLSTANAYNSARFRVVRTGGGAFNLDVGGLKTLTAANQWAEVEFDGTAWRLTAQGTL